MIITLILTHLRQVLSKVITEKEDPKMKMDKKRLRMTAEEALKVLIGDNSSMAHSIWDAPKRESHYAMLEYLSKLTDLLTKQINKISNL